jgi:hypothetical protein
VNADPKTISPASGQKQDAANGQDFSKPDRLSGSSEGVVEASLWLLRIRALLFVTVCATLGVLLLILPWTARWTENPLLMVSPHLREVVLNGFTRGVSSGLGMLDLWLGFWEAIHYHENPKMGAP